MCSYYFLRVPGFPSKPAVKIAVRNARHTARIKNPLVPIVNSSLCKVVSSKHTIYIISQRTSNVNGMCG